MIQYIVSIIVLVVVPLLTTMARADSWVTTLLLERQMGDVADECLINLINMYANAIADGIVTNAALNNVGTDFPTGKKLKDESLYFQGLRVFSNFDWELGRQLRQSPIGRCLPERSTLVFARLSRSYLEHTKQAFSVEVDKALRIRDVLELDMPDFTIAYAPVADLESDAEGNILISKRLRADVLAGARVFLSDLDRWSESDQRLATRMKTVVQGLTPVAFAMGLRIPPAAPGNSSLSLEAYFPPIYELDVGDVDRIDTLIISKGIPMKELPKPVDISVAKLTHIGYIPEGNRRSNQIMKLELRKDFAKPDLVESFAVFGSLGDDVDLSALLPMSFDDFRNGVYVGFHPTVPTAGLPVAIRPLAEEFNRRASELRFEARIHRLRLLLNREATASAAAYDRLNPLLQPYFSMRDSDISFRVYSAVKEAKAAGGLRLVGFTCESQDGGFHCWQDFGAYDELLSHLQSGEGGEPRDTVWILYRRVLNSLVRLNARFIINWNIRAIERAIDLQFHEIVDEVVSKQAEKRADVAGRLENAVFGGE